MWLWKWKAKTKQRQFQRVRSVGTKPFASKMPETREIITVLEICQTLIYSKSSSLTESNSLTLCILVFKLNSVWSIASWLYSNPSTTWKVSKYGVFSGPYFPAFGLNTEIYWIRRFTYSVEMRENTDPKKLRIWTLFTQWKVRLFIYSLFTVD